MTEGTTHSASVSIDGVSLPVTSCESLEEAAAKVAENAAGETPIFPVGGGTKLFVGTPPPASGHGVALALDRCSRLIDYPARDMTITVECGMRMAELQAILSAENQRLPVDVAQPEQSTLGGALAVNESGPRRFGWGTFRDYVIGMTVINDRGEQVKSGGRVVKNVAGYDLAKLFVGSLGTLAVLGQVTFKVLPKPESGLLLVASVALDALSAFLDSLHKTQTRPICIEVVNPWAIQRLGRQVPLPGDEGLALVVIGYEGNEAQLTWQLRQATTELRSARSLDVFADRAAEQLWQALTSFPALTDAVLTIKIATRPSAAGQVIRQVTAIEPAIEVVAHAGNGIAFGHVCGSVDRASCLRLVEDVRRIVRAAGGYVTVWKCPAEWKNTSFVWGDDPPGLAMMHKVKQELDPKKLFNPGRFVGGI